MKTRFRTLLDRWLLPGIVAIAGVVAISVWAANDAWGQQPEPGPRTGAEFAHKQYVTHLELAQKEVKQLKETRLWMIGAICSLLGSAVAFGRNSRAITEFRDDLKRHSKVHEGFREAFSEADSHISQLSSDVKLAMAGVEARVDELGKSVDELARINRMASTKGALEEIKEMLREGIKSAKDHPESKE